MADNDIDGIVRRMDEGNDDSLETDDKNNSKDTPNLNTCSIGSESQMQVIQTLEIRGSVAEPTHSWDENKRLCGCLEFSEETLPPAMTRKRLHWLWQIRNCRETGMEKIVERLSLV